jgi:hypothetical protein
MSMKTTVLYLCLSLMTSVARAQQDSPEPAAVATPPKPARAEALTFTPPEPHARLKKRIGLGLLIGSAASLALGITFVALAKTSNDAALSNGTYDPSSEDRRNAFQITHTVFFAVGAAAFTSGMVLIWDR